MTDQASTPTLTGSSLPNRLAKLVAAGFLAYVVGLAIYAFANFASTRSKLLTYGLSDATANFLGMAVMLVALALPAMAIVRIAFWRPRPLDYAAALLLPALSWAIAQLPAKFDAVTGEALQYCAPRPDGSKFCLDRPGVDPLTQRTLTKVDSQSAEEDFRRDRDLLPRRVTAPITEIAFFDAITGKPRIWVSKNEAGCYDMFNNPGVNPYTGEQLEAVSRSIVQAIRKCTPSATPSGSANKPSGTAAVPSAQAPAANPSPLPRTAPQPVPDPAVAAREAQRIHEEAELQRVAVARAREQQERKGLIEATTKGNLSEFCASLLRTCDGNECISIRTVPESMCVRDCGATSWGSTTCVEKACTFEIAELRSKGVIGRFEGRPDRGIGPPGCVGFRPDIRGSSDGAECLKRFFGEGYYVNPRLCSQDGSAYNVRLR